MRLEEARSHRHPGATEGTILLATIPIHSASRPVGEPYRDCIDISNPQHRRIVCGEFRCGNAETVEKY
ncbi:hypothetical protein K470DRAFT_259774 [Piedraia hortae CBS 480.64]|uniref:Uncharacterized protein n=1 Tax=Piedraia hortae CBS 480.64 TaxID=1314780 RepID=A0A6A7BTS5_9PEZI|nr:hypothetical protein K470DRAFT_259774 [Piedraia hortae CBS 480.64]